MRPAGSWFPWPRERRPGGKRVELAEHGLLHQIGQLIDDESSLLRVFALGQSPFPVDDQLDGQGPGTEASVGVVMASS